VYPELLFEKFPRWIERSPFDPRTYILDFF
jgi:hypothetical protein